MPSPQPNLIQLLNCKLYKIPANLIACLAFLEDDVNLFVISPVPSFPFPPRRHKVLNYSAVLPNTPSSLLLQYVELGIPMCQGKYINYATRIQRACLKVVRKTMDWNLGLEIEYPHWDASLSTSVTLRERWVVFWKCATFLIAELLAVHYHVSFIIEKRRQMHKE